ncbi:NAD(P)-dependent oxidoreductase [Desulfuromonas acetoxidans]|uniref:3-hydroxyisobutyrate dehydrogenase n=1 Tax=Desulfuromonas acetoxidans (strain DSM 684 / 11070) TaxID=281689 RepID=Q1JWJ9_DESA6|nr:NAD(P)-dependent oxidoreductase [Desulfuromonas acetoxidans]EAT14569.1 3-hydroxyisobutyrate dehydrogenase [Desulfuromonas acetoxidans DSM 684]MBF0646286.1 NAD(P)-dependent oxidoreductase [Desulfuromonas acetoxidans]NVD25714.1 NAD(P)-dependent oxidoreductase [Desulfuromonas acetoxidans]NVE17010.1 NAD(P)-dependent oxidoreductase [Desulfuromonas acetoxidans]
MIKEIGFIGLGTVGKSMATNLLKGNYNLTVFDHRTEAVDELVAKGAKAASTTLDAVKEKDLVMTVLPDEEELKQALSSAGSFLEGIAPGTILCDLGTHSLEVTMEVSKKAAQNKIMFLDAPVWGTKEHAAHGLLTILIGGDNSVVSRCREVLSHVGLNILHVGDVGDATKMKFVVTLMQSQLMEALAESLVLGDRLGFTNDQILEVLDAGGVASPLLHKKGRSVARGDFSRNLALKYVHAGLCKVKEAADITGARLPGMEAVLDLYTEAMEDGRGEEDFSAIIKVLQK